MKKNEIRGIAVLGIIFVTLSVIAFAIPFAKNAAFWFSYIFAIISIGVQGYAAYSGFAKANSKSKLYGFPIARIGTIYMIAQLVVSIIFMALAKIIPLPVVIVVCVVALAAVSVGIISAEAVRDELKHQDKKLKVNVKTIRGLQSKTRMLPTLSNDSELVKKLNKFADAMQYSDPVSNEALEQIEGELEALVDEIQQAIIDGDIASADSLLKKATLTLAERNRLCKLNKH